MIAPRPALVVKVDNVDAAPQSGLNQADIVFEEIVEGQATRFAAVFNSMDADPVGPIRSARTQDVNLLLSLNDPALAYSGANDGVNAALGSAGFELLTEGDPGFFRDDSRPAPHNLFANTSELWSQLSSSGDAVPAFEYVAPGAPVAGTPVSFVEMMVGDYNVRWDWDGTQRLFLRSQLGAPHMLTDGQASANTVVVLVVPYGVSAAGGGPEAQTIGTGTAVVYSDGVEIDGTWTRASATDPFTLEANGQPILIAPDVPGSSWSTPTTASPTADRPPRARLRSASSRSEVRSPTFSPSRTWVTRSGRGGVACGQPGATVVPSSHRLLNHVLPVPLVSKSVTAP